MGKWTYATVLQKPGSPKGDPLTYGTSPRHYQYATSFHWSLTQLAGSMQINAQNTIERVFNICCLLIGLLFFGTLVSVLSGKAMEAKMVDQEKTLMLSTLRRFLREHSVE